MHKAHMLAYGALSGLTPTLVLMNSLQGTPTFPPPTSTQPQPLQSMRLVERLMNSGPKSIVTSYAFRPHASTANPQARIFGEDGQFFLELYNPFSTSARTPDLMLILDANPIPDGDFSQSDRQYWVGNLQAAAGKQRYAIPASVDVYQYLSVVIWCPEFDAIMGYAPLVFGV